MGNLSIFEREVLEILEQLEHCCKIAEFRNPEKIKKDKFIEIIFGDIDFSVLKKPEDIHDVAKFLQKIGVDFYIKTEAESFIDGLPLPGESVDKYYRPPAKNTQLGIIKGENFQDIKIKIKKFKSSLENESDLKNNTKTKAGKTNSKIIEKIEILKSTNKLGRIKAYINEDYSHELDFSREKAWGLMYELAENKQVSFNKGFYDYFNSNKENPLYKRWGFSVTKILKQESNVIVPNIKISLIIKKTVTQRLNPA
jgi:hypothetical protein